MCELLITKDDVKLRFFNNELKFLKKEVNSAMKDGSDCQFSFPRSSEQLCVEKNEKLVIIEYKQTKRALWLARAERARAMMHVYAYNAGKYPKWQAVERKCREKAEYR